MYRPSDFDVKEMVAALQEAGSEAGLGVNGLQFMCRSAARMIKEMRPDLCFDPVRKGES